MGPKEPLNESQKRAVEYVDGPLLVFAGPGTGKTKVVTHKIVNLINNQGCKPEEVLALTFSDNAAQEMQERVEDLIPGITGLKISTFHSYCYEILRQYSLEIGLNSDGTVIKDEHQQTFLLHNLNDIGLTAFQVPPNPVDLAKSFRGAIARFKQENITIDKLKEYLERTKAEGPVDNGEIEKLGDLLKAYQLYEEWKAERSLIDYEDMQYFAVDFLLRMPRILERIRDKIKYIIVDEFQDTDYVQLQLLLLLAPKGNTTVVGDDDQSIYRFRGAYLTNIAEFKEFYDSRSIETESIVLETNYRCTANIQKSATTLIGNNPEREDKRISTDKDEGAPVEIRVYPDDWSQSIGIIEMMKGLNERGIQWNEIAILVRRRIDSKPIIEQMEKNRIPYEMIGMRKYFREPIVRAIVSYLKVLQDPNANQPSLGNVMRRPIHGILPGELQSFTRFAKDKGVSLWAALSCLEDYPLNPKQFRLMKMEMDNLFQHYGETDLASTVRNILFSRDFFRVEISNGNIDNIRLLNRFLKITSEYLSIYPDGTLDEFLVYIEALDSLGLEDKEKDISTDKVNLMTIHGSKGKEFSYVFIPCLNEKKIPSAYKPYKLDIPRELQDGVESRFSDEENHYQEERRLLYVGMTRAKEQLFLNYCKRYGENKRDTPESRFIIEIKEGDGFTFIEESAFIAESVTDMAESPSSILHHHIIQSISRGEWQSAIDSIVTMSTEKGFDASELNIPRKLDVERYLKEVEALFTEPEVSHADQASYSPSKLKCYEDCPQKYYYQYVLSIPDIKKTFFELGTVVHRVVEHITRKIMEGETIDNDEALGVLDSLWRSSVYQSEDLERQDREVAEKMITDFISHQAGKATTIIDIERWIEIELEGRKIRGKVDRIDDTGRTLEVIDYKTSKNRDSRPKMKKDFQMALYCVGTEEALGKPVGQVGHWYLREDREWMIEMTNDERQEVLDRAVTVIESIEEHEFNASPGFNQCKWCGYKELCTNVYG